MGRKVKKIQLTTKKEVFNYCKPYIVAELGANHNGDMNLAKKLILDAKEAGADCIKFQSWSKETLFSEIKYKKDTSLKKIVDQYSISEEELLQMKKFSDELGIDCTSTPFSKSEVDFLIEKLLSPFIKVASMDLNNYPFLEYVASKGKPVVLSTGLSELYEIDRAISTIEKTGNDQIIILHCVATYPPEDSNLNLNNINTFKTIYPQYPIGFSDHTLGTVMANTAVSLGVCFVEKHFTLDKTMEGWDHKISATKDELKEIVLNSKRISLAMGTHRIRATEGDQKKEEFRRSIVLNKDMKKGDKIKFNDLDYKRPGNGFEPGMTKFIIGRTINKNLKADHVLTESDIL